MKHEQPLPVPLAGWRDAAPGRIVRLTHDGRVILRDPLPSGDRQYAIFVSASVACSMLDHGAELPWRLDREHTLRLAEAAQ